MASESDRRPSGPPSNLIDVLHRLRERNLPGRVDNNYLTGAGISEYLVSHARFALRFLGLIDESDQPTDALRRIARATDEEYKSVLQELVRAAYADVFEVVDPGSDDRQRVLNVFRRYLPASQRDRMVMFFLAICRECGIEVLDAPRQRASGVASSRKATSARSPASRPKVVSQPITVARPAEERIASRVPSGLRLLLELLPAEGSCLPQAKREQWLSLANEALKFAYPEDLQADDAEHEDAGP